MQIIEMTVPAHHLGLEPCAGVDELADPLYWFLVGSLKFLRKTSDALVDFSSDGPVQGLASPSDTDHAPTSSVDTLIGRCDLIRALCQQLPDTAPEQHKQAIIDLGQRGPDDTAYIALCYMSVFCQETAD
jgi:hypothetical protein